MAEEATNTNTATATGAAAGGANDNPTGSEKETTVDAAKKENQQQNFNTENLDKLIQSKVDRLMADARKENATLQKELDKQKKARMSDEEVKQYEISEREKAIAAKEKELADRENRLYAIKAIKAAGLDDGGENSLELVDFVMSDTEENIDTRVKAFKSLVDKMVAAEVDKTFKTNGRTPKGANNGGQTKETSTIAETLGKTRAAQTEKSNKILNHYLGGNK